jgi:hypothetical protein
MPQGLGPMRLDLIAQASCAVLLPGDSQMSSEMPTACGPNPIGLPTIAEGRTRQVGLVRASLAYPGRTKPAARAIIRLNIAPTPCRERLASIPPRAELPGLALSDLLRPVATLSNGVRVFVVLRPGMTITTPGSLARSFRSTINSRGHCALVAIQHQHVGQFQRLFMRSGPYRPNHLL